VGWGGQLKFKGLVCVFQKQSDSSVLWQRLYEVWRVPSDGLIEERHGMLVNTRQRDDLWLCPARGTSLHCPNSSELVTFATRAVLCHSSKPGFKLGHLPSYDSTTLMIIMLEGLKQSSSSPSPHHYCRNKDYMSSEVRSLAFSVLPTIYIVKEHHPFVL
jgi:hypothetical protein